MGAINLGGFLVFQKRTFLIFGLMFGLVVWPIVQAEDSSEPVEVLWMIEGCSLELAAPSSLDLGTATPGELLTSGANDGKVEIDSTCAYTVTIRLDGFEKDGSAASGDLLTTLLTQYEFRTESVQPASKIDNLQPSFTAFGSVGDVQAVCKSKDSASPPFRNHKCKLQFQVDTTLLPQGEYKANHTVTASTP
jgi:hypothetical protein